MPSTRTTLEPLPWQRFESLLMDTSRSLRRAVDERLAPLGLNLTQTMLLAYVDEYGPVPQVSLAEALHMNRGSTGVVVDALHDRGLIRRDASSTDRRVWLISTTAAGRKLAAEAKIVDVAVREELRAGISRAERAQLVRTLVRIQENVDAILSAEG